MEKEGVSAPGWCEASAIDDHFNGHHWSQQSKPSISVIVKREKGLVCIEAIPVAMEMREKANVETTHDHHTHTHLHHYIANHPSPHKAHWAWSNSLINELRNISTLSQTTHKTFN